MGTQATAGTRNDTSRIQYVAPLCIPRPRFELCEDPQALHREFDFESTHPGLHQQFGPETGALTNAVDRRAAKKVECPRFGAADQQYIPVHGGGPVSSALTAPNIVGCRTQ